MKKPMSPADQEASKKVVLGCLKIMFDKATHQHLVQGLQGPAPMPMKLAANAVGVLKMFSARVEQEGKQIPRQVLAPAAAAVILEIAEFAAKAGLGKPTGADVKAAVALLPKLLKNAFPNRGAPGQPAQAPAAPAAAPAVPAAPAAVPPAAAPRPAVPMNTGV